jgi:hypothetical protein
MCCGIGLEDTAAQELVAMTLLRRRPTRAPLRCVDPPNPGESTAASRPKANGATHLETLFPPASVGPTAHTSVAYIASVALLRRPSWRAHVRYRAGTWYRLHSTAAHPERGDRSLIRCSGACRSAFRPAHLRCGDFLGQLSDLRHVAPRCLVYDRTGVGDWGDPAVIQTAS